jgi:hypothetical protein
VQHTHCDMECITSEEIIVIKESLIDNIPFTLSIFVGNNGRSIGIQLERDDIAEIFVYQEITTYKVVYNSPYLVNTYTCNDITSTVNKVISVMKVHTPFTYMYKIAEKDKKIKELNNILKKFRQT